MLVVGLTGGIGSGKSTAAQYFADLEVPIIDADLIARQLTQQPEICQQLSEHFGPTVIKEDKTLNRSKLRQLIFSQPQEKQWLEAYLHPLIIEQIKREIAAVKKSYCIVVIPLLLETGPYPFVDRILVIESLAELRVERAQARDQTSAEEIQKIINTQASDAKRLVEKQDLIVNNGSFEKLKEQVLNLHHSYLALSNSP